MPTSEYYPSRMQPVLTRIFQSFSFALARWRYQLSLQVSLEDIAKLRTLRDERVILMPNHPTFHDPIVLFLLSARAGELFHFLAATGAFQGVQGKIIQLLGAYSIQRGVGDRASIAYTLDLLQQSRSRLVIFPEGGCSFQNDTVMPFRTGAVQLPLQAMNRLVKKNESGAIPNFYLVPVSLKYRYTRMMDSILEQTLHGLEKEFNLCPQQRDFYPRLRMVGEAVLRRIENEYQVQGADGDLNTRISRMRECILNTCETQLGIPPNQSLPIRERVYKILFQLEASAEPHPNHEAIYRDVLRLLNFDALYDGYVAETPTPERFLDTLIRLEREVFQVDQPQPKGDRRVYVKIGDPINLADYWADYRRDRTATVNQLTDLLRGTVQANLDQLEKETRSLLYPLQH